MISHKIGKMPKKKIGKPPLLESPDELQDLFDDYIEECIDEGKVPSVAGFRANKGISRDSYIKYEAKEEFTSVYGYMTDVLEDLTINSSSVDGQTKKLILQTKFGYMDRSSVESKNLEIDLIELVKAQLTPQQIASQAKLISSE